MPIYEYYCPMCNARFQHLARSFSAPTPVCPGCGNAAVEKLVSRASLGRTEAARRAAFDARASAARDGAAEVQAAARLLQEGGALLDEVTPLGMDREIFREIVARRAQGAQEDDFQDLVDAMPLPAAPEAAAGHEHEHEHDHEHDHEHSPSCDHGHNHHPTRSRRHARDLGWG